MNKSNLSAQINVNFRDPFLLKQALTHRSYINEHGEDDVSDNERLEFLGDAVLDFIVGDMLYRRYPNMPEGDLTRLRAAMVRTESLAEVALRLRLGEQLRMGKGEESTGGRERQTNLCAAFEAFVGALYLDQSVEAVRTFVEPFMNSQLEQILNESLDRDARSQLQEWSQAELNLTPVYRTVSAKGPDHRKEFLVEVIIGEAVAGQGTGRSKQTGAQAAARAALQQIKNGDFP